MVFKSNFLGSSLGLGFAGSEQVLGSCRLFLLAQKRSRAKDTLLDVLVGWCAREGGNS